MDLLIDKKYLVRLESYTKFGYGGSYDPWAVRYVFALPENAGLPAGYTVYIDAENVEWERDENGRRSFYSKPLYTGELENNRTYRLNRERDAEYVATMTENREKGKRYRRYKYTAEELYAIYQNVNLSSAQLVIAKVKIYNKGRLSLYEDRIADTKYLIGKVKDRWFYCSELDTKRRIGSYAVKILGNIDVNSEPMVRELIEKYQSDIKDCKHKYWEYDVINRKVENFLSECKSIFTYHQPQSEEVNEAISDIQKSSEVAQKKVLEELKDKESEANKIIANFENQLKKFYRKEITQ